MRLFDDHVDEPVQAVGARFVRAGLGHYLLHDVPSLAACGWQIEIPQDENGSRLVHIVTQHDPVSDTMTVQTSQPVWSMQSMSWQAGDPVGIPKGRWVDLRFAPDGEDAEDG